MELVDTAAKAGLDALQITSKKVVYKAAETTGEFIDYKIANIMVKTKSVMDKNSRNVEEIVIPPDKRQIISKL